MAETAPWESATASAPATDTSTPPWESSAQSAASAPESGAAPWEGRGGAKKPPALKVVPAAPPAPPREPYQPQSGFGALVDIGNDEALQAKLHMEQETHGISDVHGSFFSRVGQIGAAEAKGIAGTLTQIPGSLAAYGIIAARALGLTKADPSKVAAAVNHALAYEPRNERAQAVERLIGLPFSALDDLGDKLTRAAWDPKAHPHLYWTGRFLFDSLPLATMGARGVERASGAVRRAAAGPAAYEEAFQGAVKGTEEPVGKQPPAPTEPTDLFGARPDSANELLRETARRDEIRRSGIGVPADRGGGLFSDETKQLDLTAAAPRAASQPPVPPSLAPTAFAPPDRVAVWFDQLKREIGWEERGGHVLRAGTSEQPGLLGAGQGDVTGRTHWIGKAGPSGEESAFWRDRPGPGKINEKEALSAFDKAEAGEKLTKREQRFIDYARSVAEDYARSEQQELYDTQADELGRQSDEALVQSMSEVPDEEWRPNLEAAKTAAQIVRRQREVTPEAPELISIEDASALAHKAAPKPHEIAAEWARETRDTFRNAFPDLREKNAELAAAVILRAKSTSEWEMRQFAKPSEARFRLFAREFTPADNLRFYDAMQKGLPLEKFETESGKIVNLQPVADLYRRLMDDWHQKEQDAGLAVAYRKNYLPDYFDQPSKFYAYLQAKWGDALGAGKASFQRERFFEFLSDALKARDEQGRPLFHARFDNVEDFVRARWIDHNRLMEKAQALGDMERYGLIRWGSAADAREGEVPVEDDAIGTYLAPKSVAPLLNDTYYARSKSFWTDKTISGALMRGWLNLRKTILPVRLAGLFHPDHLLFGVKTSSGFAETMHALFTGDKPLRNLPKAAGLAAKHWVGLGDHIRGVGRMMKLWRGELKDPQPSETLMMSDLLDAGYRFDQPAEFRAAGVAGFKRAHAYKNYLGMGIRVPGVIMRAIQYPVMDWLVPHIKLQAMMDGIAWLRQNHPELADNEELRLRTFNRLRQQFDQRFGEMAYDTLFWPKRMQEAMQATFLSFTWNYGFWKQFGGAALDLTRMARAAGKPFADKIGPGAETSMGRFVQRFFGDKKASEYMTSRLAYAITYNLQTMLIAGLMTKFLGGRDPQTVKDLVYPVCGHDLQGNEYRCTTPFFTRNEGELYYHTATEGWSTGLWNVALYKATPMASAMYDMLANRNFYGVQLADPSDPLATKAADYFKAFLQDMEPISAASVQEKGRTRGKDWTLSILGFAPAPSYASRSLFVSKVMYLYGEENQGVKTPEEGEQMNARRKLRALWANGQQDAFNRTLASDQIKYRWSGRQVTDLMESLYEPPGAYEFSRLAPKQQARLMLEEATPDQRRAYLPYMSQKAMMLFSQEGGQW